MSTHELPEESPGLEDAIQRAFEGLNHAYVGSDDYVMIVDQIVKLHALRDQAPPRRVSPDTLAIVLGNLAGIALIVGHERMNVVTSKALGFVMKLR